MVPNEFRVRSVFTRLSRSGGGDVLIGVFAMCVAPFYIDMKKTVLLGLPLEFP
jgi:hypothetical protein